jgi:hypothetical protein
MPTHFVADQLAQGTVILDRFAATATPSAVKTPLAAFKSVHATLVKLTTAATTAQLTRDTALQAVGTADDALDVAVLRLADKIAGAEIGTRKNPFASFSAHAPAAVTTLAYATEVKEVLAICAKVTKTKPSSDVAKAAAACVKLAGGVSTSLTSLSKPQVAYARALAARDALLPGWTKALTTLKRTAYLALDDDATAKAIFAPPSAVQAPKKKRPVKAKAPAAAAKPAAPAVS